MQRSRDLIRGGLSQVWDSGGRAFVTFELVRDGRPDPDRWVQWLEGDVNFRWPLDEDPRTALPRLGAAPPARAVAGWFVPGSNAVVHALDVRADDVADFVDALFRRVLGGGPRPAIAVRVERQ